jgi:chorismate-pyruvate lyase
LPELRAGQTLDFRVAAERLRQAKLLSRSGSLTRLFAAHAGHFVLQPEGQPQQVRLKVAP